MTERPTAFADLPTTSFPIRMRFIDMATMTVHEDETLYIARPGAVVIPGHPNPTAVECVYGDGEICLMSPDGSVVYEQAGPELLADIAAHVAHDAQEQP